MVARLGMVIYWAATGIAVILALGTAVMVTLGVLGLAGYTSENAVLEAFVLVPALLIWLFGRACRYVLAGD